MAKKKTALKKAVTAKTSTQEGAQAVDPAAVSNPVGRPTKYVDINLEQVEKFCKLGATDAQLADFLNVSEATINNWKNEHSEFLETVRRGKNYSDEAVVESLYNRALGEVKEIREQKMDKDGCVHTLTKDVLVVADTKAIEFWLKNRRPDEWRDKRDHNHTGNLAMSFAEMAAELDKEDDE